MASRMPRGEMLDVHALVERTGFDARTIRRYIERGLLPRPILAGRQTRYGHEHLVRLLAIGKLYEKSGRLSVIQAELDKRSFPELEALAGLAEPGEVRGSVGDVVAPAARDASATSVEPAAPRATSMDAPSKGERWTKVTLLAGLELMVRDDATDFVRRIAREIEERYSGAR